MEGEPLLLALHLATTLPPIRPIHDEAVSTFSRFGAIESAMDSISCPGRTSRWSQEWYCRHLYPEPARIPGHQRLDTVCLHSRRQSASLDVVRLDGDHRSQRPEAGEFAVKHLVVWPYFVRWDAYWGHDCLQRRRDVFVRQRTTREA